MMSFSYAKNFSNPGSCLVNLMKLSCILLMAFQKNRKSEGTSNGASIDFMTLKSDAHIVAPVS